MGTDVADATAGTRARRIGTPVGLLLAGGLNRIGQPILRVFDLHDSDRTEFAALNHGACMADERITGIIIGDGKYPSARAGPVAQAARLLKGGRQRLVADDVNARLQEGVGNSCVHMVWGHDRNRFDTVGSRGFGLRHGPKVRIGSIGPKADRSRRSDRFVGRGRKRASDEFVTIVQARGDTVDGADEGAFPAAYYSQSNA
jgi:hypothetical protein